MSAPPAACERTPPGLLVSSLNSPLTAFDHPCLTAMAHPKVANTARPGRLGQVAGTCCAGGLEPIRKRARQRKWLHGLQRSPSLRRAAGARAAEQRRVARARLGGQLEHLRADARHPGRR